MFSVPLVFVGPDLVQTVPFAQKVLHAVRFFLSN